MPVTDIPSLAVGDRVQSEFLVIARIEKQTTNGDPYVLLTLGNSTGRIESAPIWTDKREWAAGIEPGRVVQLIGEVTRYDRNGTTKRQLTITSPPRILPPGEFDPTDFLECIENCTPLWDWIDRQRAAIRSATLRAVVNVVFGDDAFRLRFEKTPGSINRHHAKLGGLLLHTYEVASIARNAARTMRADVDLVVAGALLHDIGKVEAYEVSPSGFGYTPCGLLLGHVVLGALMLERALARLGEPVCSEGQLLELQHMILSHHGTLDFGSPVQPMTTEAELVHWADEASAKGADMMESMDDPANFPGGKECSDRKVWRVDRRLWKRPHEWS